METLFIGDRGPDTAKRSGIGSGKRPMHSSRLTTRSIAPRFPSPCLPDMKSVRATQKQTACENIALSYYLMCNQPDGNRGECSLRPRSCRGSYYRTIMWRRERYRPGLVLRNVCPLIPFRVSGMSRGVQGWESQKIDIHKVYIMEEPLDDARFGQRRFFA